MKIRNLINFQVNLGEQVARFGEGTLEEELDDRVVGQAEELHHFRRKEVTVLLQEERRVVRHFAGVVTDAENAAVRLGRYEVGRFDVLLELVCNHFIRFIT